MSREKSYLEKTKSHRPQEKKTQVGEGASDSRMAKISFKNYLRQVEEETLEEDDDLFEDDKILPTTDEGIDELYDAFTSENDDLCKEAREKADAHEGTEFLMKELETWLQNRGYNGSDVETWMEGSAGDHLFDMFYNGLT